ncbi:hypothetical protein F4680DRAFT_28562 [Xylaria scruposa]|nr:hypothetical protein F4680DRAFT_28562 [Xylaria scruposa]
MTWTFCIADTFTFSPFYFVGLAFLLLQHGAAGAEEELEKERSLKGHTLQGERVLFSLFNTFDSILCKIRFVYNSDLCLEHRGVLMGFRAHLFSRRLNIHFSQ